MNLLNFALYQAGWFAVVLGAASGRPWAGTGIALVLLAVHLWRVPPPRAEWKLMLLAGGTGAGCGLGTGPRRWRGSPGPERPG